MRVLVVDDEEYIRRGIANKIKKNIPYVTEVYECGDAHAAMQILEETKPQVIVTDIRMPEVDGLSFIEKATKIDPNIKFIIVSGYQEFEYARKAIALQVEGYLLKPIENEQLINLFDNIKEKLSSKTKLQNYITNLKSQAKDGISFMQNKYLVDLIYCKEPLHAHNIINILESLDIHFDQPYYSVIVIKLMHIHPELGFGDYKDIDTIKFVIKNITKEIISLKGMKAVVFEDLHTEGTMCAVINHNAFGNHDVAKKKECYNHISDNLHELVGLDVRIGSGGDYKEVENIEKAYQEAYTAALLLSEEMQRGVIDITEVKVENTIQFFLEDSKKMMLISYIQSMDYEAANKIIDELFDTIRKSKLSNENIKVLSLEIFMMLTKFVVEEAMSVDTIFKQNICSEEYIMQYSSLNELRNAIQSSIKAICDYMIKVKRSDGETAIEEIKKYIEQYYYTEINLSQLANKYFINASYLSQLFKNKTGKRFSDYITNVRIEKAKELLLTTNLKAYQISEVIGYNNPRYFSEVFVKYQAVTPTQYRQSHIK